MSKYTLKTYCGGKILEKFTNRSTSQLYAVLNHPKNHKAGITGPFGEILENSDTFEILDSQMDRIFIGNVNDALNTIKRLR